VVATIAARFDHRRGSGRDVNSAQRSAATHEFPPLSSITPINAPLSSAGLRNVFSSVSDIFVLCDLFRFVCPGLFVLFDLLPSPFLLPSIRRFFVGWSACLLSCFYFFVTVESFSRDQHRQVDMLVSCTLLLLVAPWVADIHG